MEISKKQKRMTWLAIGSIVAILGLPYGYGRWKLQVIEGLERSGVRVQLVTVISENKFNEIAFYFGRSDFGRKIFRQVIYPYLILVVQVNRVTIDGGYPLENRNLGGLIFRKVEFMDIGGPDIHENLEIIGRFPGCRSLKIGPFSRVEVPQARKIVASFPHITFMSLDSGTVDWEAFAVLDECESLQAIDLLNVTIQAEFADDYERKVIELLVLRPGADRAKFAKEFPGVTTMEFDEFMQEFSGKEAPMVE